MTSNLFFVHKVVWRLEIIYNTGEGKLKIMMAKERKVNEVIQTGWQQLSTSEQQE